MASLREQLKASKSKCAALLEKNLIYAKLIENDHQKKTEAMLNADQLEGSEKNFELNGKIVENLQSQLQIERQEKTNVQLKLGELQSYLSNLEEEKRVLIEERNNLSTQLVLATASINKYIEELNINNHSENIISNWDIRNELQHRVDEIGKARATISKLTKRNDELSMEFRTQASESNEMRNHFENVLASNIKLQNLHLANYKEQLQRSEELRHSKEEIQKQLSETLKQCQMLKEEHDTLVSKHDNQMAEQNLEIDQLKLNITDFIEQLSECKVMKLEEFLEELTPAAAAASRKLTTSMKLTEIYILYTNSVRELDQKTFECQKVSLELKLAKSDLAEIASIQIENAKYRTDLFTQEIDNLKQQLATSNVEQNKLKLQRLDLSRQVCHLLQKIETNNMEEDYAAKKCITFNDITQLQETNINLLTIIRDLENKLITFDDLEANQTIHERKCTHLGQQITNLDQFNRTLNTTVNSLESQVKQFKDLYFQSKSENKRLSELLSAATDQFTNTNAPMEINSSIQDAVDTSELFGMADDNETVILKKRIANFEKYCEELIANEAIIQQQLHAVSTDFKALSSLKCDLTIKNETKEKKIQDQLVTIGSQRQQIEALEERNRLYDNIIQKHEVSISKLQEICLKTQTEMTAVQSKFDKSIRHTLNLETNIMMLKIKRDGLLRERNTHSLLMTDIKLLDSKLEQLHNLKSTKCVDELQHDLNVLREKWDNEVVNSAALRNEVEILRIDITEKSKQLTDLTNKQQEESLQSCTDVSPVVKTRLPKVHYQNLCFEQSCIIEKLKEDLKVAQNALDNFTSTTANWELKYVELEQQAKTSEGNKLLFFCFHICT